MGKTAIVLIGFVIVSIPNYSCCLQTFWTALVFCADFNFRGLWTIILILFRENRRVYGTTRLSLNRSTVQKENLWPKYLKCNGIKDTCSLTDKQTKRTYLQIRRLNKMTVQNKTMESLSCLLFPLCHTTLFAIKLFVVYSECNIIANIIFNKETKQVRVCQIQQQKKINQRDTE